MTVFPIFVPRIEVFLYICSQIHVVFRNLGTYVTKQGKRKNSRKCKIASGNIYKEQKGKVYICIFLILGTYVTKIGKMMIDIR